MQQGGKRVVYLVIKSFNYLPDRNVRVRLSKGFKSDLKRWLNFACFFNGVSSIIIQEFHEYVLTDASTEGYGIVHKADWKAGLFNSEVLPVDLGQVDPRHFHFGLTYVFQRFIAIPLMC